MAGSVYFIQVTNVDTDEVLAMSYGNLGILAYVSRDVLKSIKDAKGTFKAEIFEVESVGDADAEPIRTLTTVQGDCDTVTYVVKKKVASERKASGVEDATSEDAPEASTPLKSVA